MSAPPAAAISSETKPADAAPQAARPEFDPDAAPHYSHDQVCEKLVTAAQQRDLPVAFFARLIWQESHFKPKAVSPVGAIGIAQFMPATARGMELENPFDALQALPASAELLVTLKRRFGNIGLAAAAYNSTPKRIADWLQNKAKLPDETKRYVLNITGRPAESWRGAKAHGVLPELPRYVPCTRNETFVQVERSERLELQRAQAERMVAERAEAARVKIAARVAKAAAGGAKATLAFAKVPAAPAKAAPATASAPIKVASAGANGQVAMLVSTKSPAVAGRKVAVQKPAVTAQKSAAQKPVVTAQKPQQPLRLVANTVKSPAAQAKPAPKTAAKPAPIKLAGKIKVASAAK